MLRGRGFSGPRGPRQPVELPGLKWAEGGALRMLAKAGDALADVMGVEWPPVRLCRGVPAWPASCEGLVCSVCRPDGLLPPACCCCCC